MNKPRLFIAIAVAISLIAFSSCKKDEFTVTENNTELTLDYKKKVNVLFNNEKYSLEYTELEESRCAPTVLCFAAGWANIKLELEDAEIELQTPGDQRSTINEGSAKGIRIILKDVNYDNEMNFGEAKHSSAQIILIKE